MSRSGLDIQLSKPHYRGIRRSAVSTSTSANLHGTILALYMSAVVNELSLVPVSRLQAWIEHNVYLSLKSVPFSKEDETLLPEADSCINCPKRTGINTLLFSEVREDSCVDAACFNRKLEMHIAQRVTKTPKLLMISENYNMPSESPILPRRSYVEVVSRKSKKGKAARPEEELCTHFDPGHSRGRHGQGPSRESLR